MDDRRDRDEAGRPGELPTDGGATFETVRVRDGRRAPVAVAALTLAVTGLAGAAILGSQLTDGQPPEAAIAGSPPPAPTSVVVRTARPMPLAGGAVEGAPPGEPGPLLGVETRTSGRLVLVHGDVFTINAVVVIVSLVDTADELIGIESVDMPGGSTALRTGANDRFDLAFRLADARAPAWVEANAYDRIGRRIATARAPVQVPFAPMRSRFGAGS